MSKESMRHGDLRGLKTSVEQTYKLSQNNFQACIHVIARSKLESLSRSLSDEFIDNLEGQALSDFFVQTSMSYQNEMLGSFHCSLEAVVENLEDWVEKEKNETIDLVQENLESRPESSFKEEWLSDEIDEAFKDLFDFIYQQTRRKQSFKKAIDFELGLKEEDVKEGMGVFTFESYRKALLSLDDLENKVKKQSAAIKKNIIQKY
jgi:hypothetical protein